MMILLVEENSSRDFSACYFLVFHIPNNNNDYDGLWSGVMPDLDVLVTAILAFYNDFWFINITTICDSSSFFESQHAVVGFYVYRMQYDNMGWCKSKMEEQPIVG